MIPLEGRRLMETSKIIRILCLCLFVISIISCTKKEKEYDGYRLIADDKIHIGMEAKTVFVTDFSKNFKATKDEVTQIHVSYSDPKDLTWLDEFPHLNSLLIHSDYYRGDTEIRIHSSTVKEIFLGITDYEDRLPGVFTPRVTLLDCPNLVKFSADRESRPTFACVPNMPKLVHLDMRDGSMPRDFDLPLKSQKEFNMGYVTCIEDGKLFIPNRVEKLDLLAVRFHSYPPQDEKTMFERCLKLKNLKYLALNMPNSVLELNRIRDLPKLRGLYLEAKTIIDDGNGFVNMPQLEYIHFIFGVDGINQKYPSFNLFIKEKRAVSIGGNSWADSNSFYKIMDDNIRKLHGRKFSHFLDTSDNFHGPF
jgi:hypothetical protein